MRGGVWLSLVERFVRDEEVARSNRVTPTIIETVRRQSLFSKKPLTTHRSMNIIIECVSLLAARDYADNLILHIRRCRQWQYLRGKHHRLRQAAERLLT